jgi:hypothetical protein
MAASWTRHPIISGVVGVLAGALVIALFEWLGHQWLGKADVAEPATITTTMFASVLAAWVLGAGTAALVATAWRLASSLRACLWLARWRRCSRSRTQAGWSSARWC